MEQYGDVFVCRSSSAESVSGCSDDEDVCTEEVVDDEGVSELVLIPRREVRAEDMMIMLLAVHRCPI